jgi:hypothetical protein
MVRGSVDIKDSNDPKIICEKVDDTITRMEPDLKNHRSLKPDTSQPPVAVPHFPPSGLQPAYHLQITVNRTGDSEHDRKRLRAVYEVITSYQGNDTFSFLIPNGQGRLQLDFPNVTTHHCVELQQKLAEMLGATAVRAELRVEDTLKQ